MDETRKSRRLIAPILGLVAAGPLVAFCAPLITPGYDASFTLAWGRDLVRGLPLDFAHPSSPTPHPLAVLAGAGAGFAPVHWAISAAGGLSVAAWLASLTLLCFVTFELTASRIAVGAAIVSAAVSAPVALLVLGASSDIPYCALGLGAVLLTLRSRHSGAVAVFMVAALLRPEAVLLACVPLTLSFMGRRDFDQRSAAHRFTWVFTVGVFAVCLILAIAAWLAMGAAGGDPLIGLHSANTNAEINNNLRGPIVALTQALPGLAGPTGWLTLAAAAIALISVAVARRTRARAARMGAAHPVRTSTRQPVAAALAVRDRMRAATITGSFIGVALIAYLAQGLIGTPLVARYLLLPALLCIALAALCIPLAVRLVRTPQASLTVAVVVGIVLVVGAAGANVSGWQEVLHARQVRAEAFGSAVQLLDTDLARHCTAPVVVRSPAMVAVTALTLDRPLRDITIADKAGAGVLLQPLTREAAELAGYGPMTSLTQQENFPTDAPPRQSNHNWALYSSCQP